MMMMLKFVCPFHPRRRQTLVGAADEDVNLEIWPLTTVCLPTQGGYGKESRLSKAPVRGGCQARHHHPIRPIRLRGR